MKVFENAEFGQVRTVAVNEEVMFCLTDVCKALELTNAPEVKKRLNKDGISTIDTIDRMGRTQGATFINESNLYKTIFQSRKESAERFTDWVTSEVLPSIRKHGGYMTPDKIEEALLNPDTLIQLAQTLKEEREKSKVLKEQIETNAPKVIFADAVSASHTSILIGDLAKLLKQNGVDTGQKRLFDWLRENGYLMKSGSSKNMPTQKSMDKELFEVKETTINNPDGSIRITKTTKVTGKGQQYFINKLLVKETTAV